MDPINYLGAPAPANPLGNFTQGLQVGTAIQQQQASQAQAVADAERRQAITDAFTKLQQPGATARDYANLAMVLPKDQSEAVMNAYKTMREEQRQATLQETGQVFSALDGGNSDLATSLLRRQADAFRNSGDEQSAQYASTLADMIGVGDQGMANVKAMLGYSMSQMPGGDKAIDAIVKLNQDRRTAQQFPVLQAQKEAELAKATSDAEKASIETKYAERTQLAELDQKAAQLGLTKAQTDEALARVRNLDASTKNIGLELAAAKAHGGLTPKNIADMEVQLNTTVNTRRAAVGAAKTAYQNIEAGANMGNGVGDLAIVNSFMRQLSPGIVTDSDYRAATASGGILAQLQALKTKVESGSLLTARQRQDFVAMSKKFYENADSQNEGQMSGIKNLVESYGLSADNVFGSIAVPTDLAALRSWVKQNNPGTSLNVDSMDEATIKANFPNGYQAYRNQAGTRQAGTVEVNY